LYANPKNPVTDGRNPKNPILEIPVTYITYILLFQISNKLDFRGYYNGRIGFFGFTTRRTYI